MDMKVFLHANWDRVLGWSGIFLGCVVVWLGWLGVSGTALTYEQLPYLISGGLFGIALIAVGSTLLLSADLRDEWRKLDKLEETIHHASLEETSHHASEDQLTEDQVTGAPESRETPIREGGALERRTPVGAGEPQ